MATHDSGYADKIVDMRSPDITLLTTFMMIGLNHHDYDTTELIDIYKVPLNSCSLSMASKSALKFPLPNEFAPFRSIISKNIVGLGSTGLVKICRRYPLSSRSTRIHNSLISRTS